MKRIRFSSTVLKLGLISCLSCIHSVTYAQEPPKIVLELDFNECDTVRLQGAIMSVNPGNRTITVAEREIRMLDIGSDDRRLKTVLMHTDGKPERLESFKAGQLVRVEGFEHPDGFVAAAKIQKISAFQGGRKESKNRPPQTKPRQKVQAFRHAGSQN
jgi:hypothetical protein